MKTSVHTTVFDEHIKEYEAWFETHADTFLFELEAIREHFNRVPENVRGIEVGLGTGKFAIPLGIKEGVEPATLMAEKARKRGIEVMEAHAERLPYADMQFDFVLFVTLCHLDNLERAFREAKRVLKPGGVLITGFLPVDHRPIAQAYHERRAWSIFYKHANFYSVAKVSELLEALGFKKLEFNQTLLGPAETPDTFQQPKPGSDIGSFVVISAEKE